jgi:hypothetical protein
VRVVQLLRKKEMMRVLASTSTTTAALGKWKVNGKKKRKKKKKISKTLSCWATNGNGARCTWLTVSFLPSLKKLGKIKSVFLKQPTRNAILLYTHTLTHAVPYS